MGQKSSRIKCKSLQLSSSESVTIPAPNIPQENSSSKLKKFASKLYSLHTLTNRQENVSPSKLISFENNSKMSIKRENSPLKKSTELKISKRKRNTQNLSSSPNQQPRCSFIDNMGFSQLIENIQNKNSTGPILSAKTTTFFNVPTSPLKFDVSPNVRKFSIINKEESKKENKNDKINKEKIKLNRDLIRLRKDKRKSDLLLEKNEENIPNKQNIKFESPLIREERKINEKLVLSDYFASFYGDYLNSVKEKKPKSDVLLFKSNRTKAIDDLIERTKNLKKKIVTEEHEFDLNAERSGKYVDSNRFDNDLIFNKFDKIKERIKFLNSHINNSDNVREQDANLKKLKFYKHISKEVEVQQDRFQLIQKSQLKNKLRQNKNIDLNKKPKEKPIHIFKKDKELIFYKNKIIQILNDDKNNFSERLENNDLLSKISNMKMSPTEFMLRHTKKRSTFI